MRIVSILLLAALVIGCKKTPLAIVEPPPLDYTAELPPGTLALRKITPAEYPDFSPAFYHANITDVRQAIDQSLIYMQAPSSRKYFPYADISHDRAVATLRELKALLTDSSAAWDPNRAIAERFEVYKSVGAPRPGGGYTGEVLFTGYYTPIHPASLTRTEQFKYPLYKRPADLGSDEEGVKAWQQSQDGSQSPYATRAQIEQGNLLAGQELVWLADRWDAYVISVQGSARLRLTDGRIYEVGYAGNNGHDYVSPGRQMIADGTIPKSQLSGKGLRDYFRQHPEQMDRYLHLNPRFIFFTERVGGPFGSLNVPVTPMASIATDKLVYPRAMPAFVSTTMAASVAGGSKAYKAFMIDQDTGGAIRAAGRCDLYIGIGPAAEGIAGQQLHPGELYYLAIKPERMGK